MCGFAGFLIGGGTSRLAGRSDAETVLRQMGSAIRHRGPDDDGRWWDAAAGIGLAHQRLSIVDLSAAGHQPMPSSSGRFVIAFNGEIYNHGELRDRLVAAGVAPAWRGHSDTETLLACIEAWGMERTLCATVGMFALAVWDRSERVLHLARDRMGEKPLYYGLVGGALVFGSELKSLRAWPGWEGVIDRHAIALLMRFNYIPAPHSIYRGIFKLPSGGWLTAGAREIEGGRLPAPRSYWSIVERAAHGRAHPFRGTDAEAVEQLESMVRDAVRLQQVADVPLGAFLSGGVDSSTVVAMMQAQSSRPVRTFTIGFDEPGYNEADHAKAVAAHLGTDHTELYLRADQARAVIPDLPKIYDEPFSDASQIPTFLVSRLARQAVTVSLSGDGGDELFCGYNRYFLGRGLLRKVTRIPVGLRRLAAGMVRGTPAPLLDALARPLAAVVPQLRAAHPSDKVLKALHVLTLERETDLYRHLVSHWTDPAALVPGAAEPATALDAAMAERHPGESFEQWMMTTDLRTYLQDDILVKVDRAAMAVSLETRVPFLDHRLVEFSLGLPLGFKLRGNEGKWLLRQLLYKHVPRTLIERPKMGFGVPIDAWLRGPLRDWAESLLDGARLRAEGWFDPALIRKSWEEHLSGQRNWQYPLWDVLMFQAWLEAERTPLRSADPVPQDRVRETTTNN